MTENNCVISDNEFFEIIDNKIKNYKFERNNLINISNDLKDEIAHYKESKRDKRCKEYKDLIAKYNETEFDIFNKNAEIENLIEKRKNG